MIVRFKKENDGCTPSTREMARTLGITSTSTIHYYLRRLERFKRIEFLGAPNTTRMIRVVGGEWNFEIENSNLEIPNGGLYATQI
jgi:SOS-response transcriptional repressor LexA